MKPETERLLSAHGWYQGRRYDSTLAEQALVKEGYELLPPALAFIRSFGGLSIPFGPEGDEDYLNLDPVATSSRIFRGKVAARYETLALSPLVPVGSVQQDHLALLMDKRGQIFAGYDSTLFFCGGSVDSALDTILSSERLTCITYPVKT